MEPCESVPRSRSAAPRLQAEAEYGGDGLGERGVDREPIAGLVVDDAQVEGVEQSAFGHARCWLGVSCFGLLDGERPVDVHAGLGAGDGDRPGAGGCEGGNRDFG